MNTEAMESGMDTAPVQYESQPCIPQLLHCCHSHLHKMNAKKGNFVSESLPSYSATSKEQTFYICVYHYITSSTVGLVN